MTMRDRQGRSSIPSARAAAAMWDIAVPSRPGRMAGVRMAGFSDRAKDLVDLQVVPYPAVTIFIDLGDGVLVDHARGQQRGSLAIGFRPAASEGAAGASSACRYGCRQWPRRRCWASLRSWARRWSPSLTSGGATPCEPRSNCVLPGHGTSGSRSRRPRLPGGIRKAGRLTRKSPSPGGRWLPAGDAFGSSNWQPRPDGAASACGPGSGPRSASPPSAPHSSSVSITRPPPRRGSQRRPGGGRKRLHRPVPPPPGRQDRSRPDETVTRTGRCWVPWSLRIRPP
jgi:hypothetical protein